MNDRIRCTYRVRADAESIRTIARNIAVEQTVEVPEALITPDIEAEYVGRIESIDEAPAASDEAPRFDVLLSYNADLAAGHLPQVVNLIFGNTSIDRRVRLIDCDFPQRVLDYFRGPNFGISGLRASLGVYGRPLLCSAIKPRGRSNARFAELAGAFAAGGGDLIKDDHNLVSPTMEDFRDRVCRCHDAVEEANARTGRRCLYLPYISTSKEGVREQIEFAIQCGARGVLIAPMLYSLETIRSIAATYPVFIMSHPTATGAFYAHPDHGVDSALLMGTLMRLAGVDASIFTNYAGRFALPREECVNIARRLREPLGEIRPGWPAPAGGMRLERMNEIGQTYGPETIILIGGALLEHGSDLAESTRMLMDHLRDRFEERLEAPVAESSVSSACDPHINEHAPPSSEGCESTEAGAASRPRVCAYNPESHRWSGRAMREYKSKDEAGDSFRRVSRLELIGNFGEATAFDLRYFEIAPGGFTSREKHEHTHVIIGVRGRGSLTIDSGSQAASADRALAIKPFDIVYVPPRAVHQLYNPSSEEPFGFFCLVDHDRDRPVLVNDREM